MTKTHSDKTVSSLQNLVDTITAIGKIFLLSHRSTFKTVNGKERLIIMGNGPSLRQTMAENTDILKSSNTLAVNFAANTPEFFDIKPNFYVLADPHFFDCSGDEKVKSLYENISEADWDMTLFIPFGANIKDFNNPHITIERFNLMGIDGAQWLQNAAFNAKRAMPRPRNVLIASIMIAIFKGFKEIYIVGADHSWMKTISVNEHNEVVSIQPHFYKDDKKEIARVNNEYTSYPLHQIIHSFYVAFKAYHQIKRYADYKGIKIYNSTPESFIDAFDRKPL